MGGAVVSRALRDRVRAAFPGVRGGAGTLYGLTEAGGGLAAGAGSEMERRPGWVGRPLPVGGVEIKDPDSNGGGEILARAPTAMSGHWGETAAPPDAGSAGANRVLGRTAGRRG